MFASRRARVLRWVAVAFAGGSLFQLGGCSLTGFKNFAQSLNPCGTVLDCDPLQYRFLTSGYQGPGVDPDIDPACTYPPFCPDDPFVNGIGNQP